MKVGALCLWAGAIPSERLLDIFTKWKPSAIWTTPSYAWYLGETAQSQEIDLRKDLAVRKIFVAGEPGGSIPETRRRIEELWGASLFDYYGLSDIFGACAGMCEKREGLHWAEDHIMVEVLDQETGRPVAEGERGELVLTSLKKRARPLIRFRTGDIVSLTTDRCGCGRTHLRLHGIHGRVDDMLIISGLNVFPSDIETFVRKNQDLTGEYRLVVTEERHLAHLTVEVEHVEGYPGAVDELTRRVVHDIFKVLGIKPRVRILPPNTLERATHKAKRVLDLRGKQEN
jgi:phenylacetate-CoA ligase